MQVSNPNNIKIYNLSAGKSLPDWLSERKKRSALKSDVDLRRRIELIQDFEMPGVSQCVRTTPDGQYVYVTGVYPPRVRCYDVGQLSRKFERGLDSQVTKFLLLSEDYGKIVFLQNDRYVEFHAQHGRYYRTRIPKFGRDMSYHHASCELYFVGISNEIYRLNLEQGRFLNSMKTEQTAINCCEFNPEHQLFICGSKEGHVECWDPRVRNRVGVLDCALGGWMKDADLDQMPSITSCKFKDGLKVGFGTSTGQILLYDIRADKPYQVKDHQFGLPIHSLAFHPDQKLVLSSDSRIVKIWHENSGKAYTSIEPGVGINELCVIPSTGMLFLANEAPKVLTYYIPTLGPAPKWASFLDSLTEELEENPQPTVYDDYKFVTRTELEGLGLGHLVGTSLLRAYMHGYFMDIRLYHKAKSLADPFAYEEYKNAKIKEAIEKKRENRVKLQKLPKVNRALAEKLMEKQEGTRIGKKQKDATALLEDDRFGRMFEDTAFQVNTESEEYKLLNPLVSKVDRSRAKREQRALEKEKIADKDEETEGRPSDDETSSDDDDQRAWADSIRKQHKLVKKERREAERLEAESMPDPKLLELKDGDSLAGANKKRQRREQKLQRQSLGSRLAQSEDTEGIIQHRETSYGNVEMTFQLKKGQRDDRWKKEREEHHQERQKIRRSASSLRGRSRGRGRGGRH